MKRILLLLILTGILGCRKDLDAYTQNQNSHIEQAMAKVRVAKDSNALSKEERKAYLYKGYQQLQEHREDSTYLKNLSQVSLVSYRLKDSLFFRKINRELSKLASKKGDYEVLGESHWDMASFFRYYGINDSAYYRYRWAYQTFDKLSQNTQSDNYKGRMLLGMARAQGGVKDYLGAESNLAKAITIFENLENNLRLYKGYNLLAINSSGQKNEERALKYLKKAGSYLKSIDNERLKWENQNNIAHTYVRNKDFENAIIAYNELFAKADLKGEHPELYAVALVSHTFSRYKTGERGNDLNDRYQEAIDIYTEIDKTKDFGRVKQYQAELLYAQGKKSTAIALAREANRFAEDTQNNDRRLEVLKFLTNLDPKNAVVYAGDYYDLSERIKEEERSTRDKFARVRLETDQVIQENISLAREKRMWTGILTGLLLLALAGIIIVVQRISNNRLKFQQKQQESNQEIYNLMLAQRGKLEEGKKLEQERISEELHDGVLGQMLGIRLVLTGLNEMIDEKSVEQRSELIEKLREVEEEIRTISHELNHASYKKIHNFIVSLEEMTRSIEESSGISCSFTYAPHIEWDSLDGTIKINAYRIAQESLQNCVKHAQCENVLVNFDCTKDTLQLTIQDDGIGFDTDMRRRGIGLRNIISRTKKIAGTLNIESIEGKGTTLKVDMPLKYAEQTKLLGNMDARESMNA